MKKVIAYIRNQLPNEIKRPSSLLSTILALTITGFFTALGWQLFDLLIGFITPYPPSFIKAILEVLTYSATIRINIATLILFTTLFILVFFSAYRFFDKRLLKKGEVVFEDDFDFGNKGWQLNYWGSNDSDKTCRIENSSIIFEADNNDLVDSKKEYGAYYDLAAGIYNGSKYEVSCWIKSAPNTTMGFKLWAHDTKGQNSIKFPASFYTPGSIPEEVKLGFVGTSSQAMRIHLHNKAGAGKIIVDKIKVVKVK